MSWKDLTPFFNSIPLFPTHKPNYQLIKPYKADELAWSLYCANELIPKYDKPQYPAPADCTADNLLVQADSPPIWSQKFVKVPLIGGYLNLMSQVQDYFATLENIVDLIASDLEKGLDSELVGKRVGVKEKSRIKWVVCGWSNVSYSWLVFSCVLVFLVSRSI